MFRLKKLSLAFVFICISILTISYSVQAGETYKWHGTGYTTKFEQVEVGDVEGHIMAIYQANQVFINDNTGEKTVSISTSTMDINPKTGLVTVEGYGVSKEPNGDVLIRAHEGKAVGKGHLKGTFKWVKGTGQYANVKGGGTWESWSLTPQVSYYEVVDNRE